MAKPIVFVMGKVRDAPRGDADLARLMQDSR